MNILKRKIDSMCPEIVIAINDNISFTIATYMLCVAVGLFAMMLFIYNRLELLQIDFQSFLIMFAFLAVGVVIGSKLLCILTRLPAVFSDFSWKRLFHTIWTAGFVFYGGLIGAIVGLYTYTKIFEKDFNYFSNNVMIAFPLFHVFGRIGCFFAGCCYGKEATWGFAMKNEPNIIRLPIQLIESMGVLCIFIILCIVEKYYSNISIPYLYLGMYSVFRLVIEFFRDDKIRGIWWGISTSQWISIAFILLTLWRVLSIKFIKKDNVKCNND